MYKINKNTIAAILGIATATTVNAATIENKIDNMAPSMMEYQMAQACECTENVVFNKTNAQSIVMAHGVQIYINYEDEIFVELTKNDEQTQRELSW